MICSSRLVTSMFIHCLIEHLHFSVYILFEFCRLLSSAQGGRSEHSSTRKLYNAVNAIRSKPIKNLHNKKNKKCPRLRFQGNFSFLELTVAQNGFQHLDFGGLL